MVVAIKKTCIQYSECQSLSEFKTIKKSFCGLDNIIVGKSLLRSIAPGINPSVLPLNIYLLVCYLAY